MERAIQTSKTSGGNVPSLDEANRVVSFILDEELTPIAAGVASGTATVESLQKMLALTIAVVGAAESLYRSLGAASPDNWESLERSAETFTDGFVVDWLASADPQVRRAITKHRRRKLSAKAGALCLVESDRSKRSRWARVTLPGDVKFPRFGGRVESLVG